MEQDCNFSLSTTTTTTIAYPPPFEPTDEQTHAAILEDAEGADFTWEQLTSAGLGDVWDVTRASASAAQDIAQGFRKHRDRAHGLSGVGSSESWVPRHTTPEPSMQSTPPQYQMPQQFPQFRHYSHPSYN
ncbi:hypothetical protein PIB30_069747 [Stylosanthes scabra]|uniref:Uncharacterized protein n=1 Tax=Stylosanthes scabra TaxID=79078 RepID=A0ABU6TMZ2_9FABA|nr:hypothetical protein [Stylosanthes scabra]